MAELRDWLNRKVLHIDFLEHDNNANIRLVFQDEVFIDNTVGWQIQTQAEMIWYNMPLHTSGIQQFLQEAGEWLKLPLEELSKTYFSGTWDFSGVDESRCTIEFGLYEQTPSKVDWFTVSLDISFQKLHWRDTLHVDHSCLKMFVDGLLNKT
jgi:hypothetical protein